ncbi:hypothetical protein R50073_09340 [Maricurvus nonylphenolicus]|uniref:hypothetical protein n=1 Tax=Maricurvus nonylphenolicus TaxID=1008307 RepID=UPI0036F41823
MKPIITIFLTIILGGCGSLAPRAVSTHDMGINDDLVFPVDTMTLAKSIIDIAKVEEWKLLYKGKQMPIEYLSGPSNVNPLGTRFENYDSFAWDKALNVDKTPDYYLQYKTQTTLTSTGAALFIVVFNEGDNVSRIAMTGSTSQIAEKEKLEIYINKLVSMLKAKYG